MWVEAILSQEDLVHLVAQLTPLTIQLGNDGDLLIHDASEVTLVAEMGLRVVCKAKLHWPVLGIGVPITLHSLTAVVVPTIRKGPDGDVLVFKLQIEHADLAGVPTSIDTRITEKVNQELAKDRAELAWDFTKTLSHAFALPRSLEPLDAFELHVAWGEVKVTEATLVLAVSFRANVTRRGDPAERPPP